MGSIFAHECRYEMRLSLDTDRGLLEGVAKITTDHDSVSLLDTKANITSIKSARLVVKENRPVLLKASKNDPIELSFLYGFDPGAKDVTLLNGWYPAI